MNPNAITAKIWFGYGKAAQKLGVPHTVYRPHDGTNPLVPANFIAVKPAIFSQDMTFMKFNKYGNAVWFAFVDGRYVKKWDYLVGPTQTWFIAEEQPDLPIVGVLCNKTISVKRPSQIQSAGLNTYAGNTQAGETPLMDSFPASVLDGSRGENQVGLPGDVRDPWWKVLLPLTPDVTIESRDVLYDEQGTRYVVSLAELSEFGWRISALQAVP